MEIVLRIFRDKRIVRLIQKQQHRGFYYWLKLVCQAEVTNGYFKNYTAQDIEDAIGWPGRKQRLVPALIEVGLLEKIADGYKLVDICGEA